MDDQAKGSRPVEVSVQLGALTSVATDPQVAVRVGHVVASLVNGVGGDPLMQLRLLHQSRSLLFDLGDTGRMPLRSAHQVSDVFITHCHADHIGGFLWFLRSRIGHFPPCRLFGPPGLMEHVSGMIRGVLWDRIEDRGPVFEVNEWHGDRLKRWRTRVGDSAPTPLDDQPTPGGVLHSEPAFQVRAALLDHGTPVLAYAFEPFGKLQVRNEQLRAGNFEPGPWLHDLKMAVLQERPDTLISPDRHSTFRAGDLARKLLIQAPGESVAYATDFAESPRNLRKVADLAKGAHTLFCEASFMVKDRDQAHRTHHLTTEACARIANEAQVRQLIAFHFSHRYQRRREVLYRELGQFTDRLTVPG